MIKQYFSIFFLVIVFSGLVLNSCKSEHSGSMTGKKAGSVKFNLTEMNKFIQLKNNQFTEAHVIGDNTAIDTMFTQDAKSFPPNAEPVIGRSAISILTKKYIDSGVSEFYEETIELYGCEDMLIDQGNYIMKYGKENTIEKGKYLNVWKKADGQWKIYSNMWNTNN